LRKHAQEIAFAKGMMLYTPLIGKEVKLLFPPDQPQPWIGINLLTDGTPG